MIEPIRASKDKDKIVFKCPQVETPLDGFTETNDFLCDASGFGRDDEPALTPDQFLEKVKKGRYYAITGVGQFQIHVTEYIKN